MTTTNDTLNYVITEGPENTRGRLSVMLDKILYTKIEMVEDPEDMDNQIEEETRMFVLKYVDIERLNRSKVSPKLRISKKDKQNLIFVFEDLETRDVALEEMNNRLKNAKINERSSRSQREKVELLKNNHELKILHDQMVKGGIVSDAEFWAYHDKELVVEKAKNFEVGVLNDLLNEIRSDKDSKKAYLSQTQKDQILRTFPGARELYHKWVPLLKTDAQFWQEFLNSIVVHHLDSYQARDDFDRSYRKHLTKTDEERKKQKILSDVDLTRDRAEYDNIDQTDKSSYGFKGEDKTGYGLKEDEMTVHSFMNNKLLMLNNININSFHVLHSTIQRENQQKLKTQLFSEASSRGDGDIEKLNIQEKNRYFALSSKKRNQKQYPQEEILKDFQQELGILENMDASSIGLDYEPVLFHTTYEKLLKNAANSISSIVNNNLNETERECLTKIETMYVKLCEILQFFYGIVSNRRWTESAGYIKKVKRIYQEIERMEKEVTLLRSQSGRSPNLTSVINGFLTCITKAQRKAEKHQHILFPERMKQQGSSDDEFELTLGKA